MAEPRARRPLAPGASAADRAPAPPQGEIIIGDCMAIMPSWADASIDACITDPPYNMSRRRGLAWAFSRHVTMEQSWDRFSSDEYVKFTRDWLAEVCRVVRPNGNLLVFGSFHNIYVIGFVLEHLLDRRIMQQITWFKPNAQPNITGRLPTESTEYVIWACNNTPRKATGWTFDYAASKQMNGGKQLRNLWQIPCTPRSERAGGKHPTQKPLELLERIVTLWTRPGDLVLDCFAGTGTTAVAAARLGRRWIGIEREADYAALARKRVAEATNSAAAR